MEAGNSTDFTALDDSRARGARMQAAARVRSIYFTPSARPPLALFISAEFHFEITGRDSCTRRTAYAYRLHAFITHMTTVTSLFAAGAYRIDECRRRFA
jgi:hypothetical protein